MGGWDAETWVLQSGDDHPESRMCQAPLPVVRHVGRGEGSEGRWGGGAEAVMKACKQRGIKRGIACGVCVGAVAANQYSRHCAHATAMRRGCLHGRRLADCIGAVGLHIAAVVVRVVGNGARISGATTEADCQPISACIHDSAGSVRALLAASMPCLLAMVRMWRRCRQPRRAACMRKKKKQQDCLSRRGCRRRSRCFRCCAVSPSGTRSSRRGRCCRSDARMCIHRP